MNNRGMMTSLLTVGAAGAAIYGIRKGIQNGTFQRLPQQLTNAMNSQTVQQMTQPIQNMMNNTGQQNQGQQDMGMLSTSDQSVQEQMTNDTKQW
ncbi:hypothetical protein SAMN05216389_12013 [Oceanobacillus limi]|uniref:Uncharacterized protein n=1 Tax=Oceanobacillus limi TaxID=930131 RepID=A0A1I0G9A0_9BACI|nr:hypothetical protein [Oceanobacillus limi]SET67439.1 hypothetical protein SAMN05216389_12013 [Oceanobacillus limi]